jgi:hypothetical protein
MGLLQSPPTASVAHPSPVAGRFHPTAPLPWVASRGPSDWT